MIFPIVILSVLALFFASLFMAQKANLQANLQNALIYFKASETDDFVSYRENIEYNRGDGTFGSIGNAYVVENDFNSTSPYRFLIKYFDEAKFKEFFLDSCNNMFFYDGTNVNVECGCKNYLLFEKIWATATQTMTIPFDTSFIGIDPNVEITAHAEVVAMDGDNFIRSTDMVVYWYEKSEMSDKVDQIISYGKDFYDKFKEFFNV